MGAHEPTISDDGQQDGEQLDADLLPEEFPDDRPLAAREYGTTEAEQARREPLGRRLRREEPDVAATGADAEDAEDADDEGDGDDGAPPDLLSPLDDAGRDYEKDLVGERARPDRHPDDSGQPRSPRSAEEDALHWVDADEPAADGDDDG